MTIKIEPKRCGIEENGNDTSNNRFPKSVYPYSASKKKENFSIMRKFDSGFQMLVLKVVVMLAYTESIILWLLALLTVIYLNHPYLLFVVHVHPHIIMCHMVMFYD
jgi:hypothetical protein